MFNIGLPTQEQWYKVAKVFMYAFVSSFIGTVSLAGGIQNNAEANLALALSGIIAGINAGIVALKITFFDK